MAHFDATIMTMLTLYLRWHLLFCRHSGASLELKRNGRGVND
jgi:hypothetical protein